MGEPAECDQKHIFKLIGERAFCSVSTLTTDLCDLATFLNDPDVRLIGDPWKLPQCYYKNLLTSYFQRHKEATPLVKTPTKEGKKSLDVVQQLKPTDLIAPTAIINLILTDEWGRNTKEGCLWQGRSCIQNPTEAAEFSVFPDRLLYLNIDGMGLTIVKAINNLLSAFGATITTDFDPFGERIHTGALDPSAKIEYHITTHVAKEELLWALASPPTPLESLARFIGGYPCALGGPNEFRPLIIRQAVKEMAVIFLRTRRNTPLNDQPTIQHMAEDRTNE